ncbi:L-serine ammonia-lyase, iron-sulfur-dependent, subunit alpha [Mediterraneibacter glycyrrhizinilyticus]|uniref:L-cysteine desulfidase family protein n=1 Tax=Mediterraneibacter glycyrrhizinilyticus TaxID=342942 RepID=UPI001D068B07|nr:L-serine ammonia-lyase, iron-sulfur-dependent, subunit alpha [Mediterraneibacter glycyrrhizinilyticus]MCB6309350.1 L-serine ammonia-lyase, iron-sulfur-dependent, subunit alpha [Lachnospiraceae bacterium 210521-DFI.1.109]MCB6426542.1 L-serine ammonia-lyase, iron-sulfur-dependent, subunit alpha [Mediterraneibacter glycyrrhizinilyticus]
MNRELYNTYVHILEEELISAMGCTEPIAIAYAASIARAALGMLPEHVEIHVSGNIIKNVKSVIVPHTGGLHGIEAAVAAGLVAGDQQRELEVIADVTEEQIKQIKAYLEQTEITVAQAETERVFEIDLRAEKDGRRVQVKIVDGHTNVVLVRRNEEILYESSMLSEAPDEAVHKTDHSLLEVEKIVLFAEEVELEDVTEVLERQITYNTAIAEEGLRGKYGANIGNVLLTAYGNSVGNRAKAWAAAGSDARMSGCELPVVINSGSGNQGITVSLPIIVYAEELHASKEQLYRALVIGNLIAIHLKTGIGCLSAYCGATSAGCGAAAGITYLYGGGYKEIAHTVVNALAINSGMVCDGAKASCAAKIASAVGAGLLGMEMYRQGSQFVGGDGIVTKGVEKTIMNVGDLAREGMAQTDKEIIQIMLR